MELFNNNDNQAPPSVVVEGMTSVSALINAVLSGKNSRRILRVLVMKTSSAKQPFCVRKPNSFSLVPGK
jgi:hypothetical protein